MPQAAAGMRIEPPVSVPMVASAMPAATLAADPPLDPPGDRVGIVRVARRPERRVLVGRPERELVQVGLADEHRAGLAQVGDRRRIAFGDVAVAHARRRGRRHAADVEQVLDRDRHAVQRTAVVAGGQLLIGLARLPQRLVGHHEDERVQPRVVGLDAAQASFGDAHRGELPRPQAAAELLDGHHRGCAPPAGGGVRGRLTAGVVVEVGGAQRLRRAGERFENRFQFRQPAALSVGDGGLQPGFDGHEFLCQH